MPKFTTSTALAGVAGAAAVTLAGFGANAALAESSPTPSASSTAQPGEATPPGPAGEGPGRGGPGHGPRGMQGEEAKVLADALGLDQAKVQTAIEKVREANKPTEKPTAGTKPTDAEREAKRTAYVIALAKELGVSADDITDALEKVRGAHQAERKSDLTEKLDAAMKAGTLTQADKASVLKALDAGVLGGGPR